MAGMDDALSKNFAGEFTMPVANLRTTALARPQSQLGLATVEESMKAKGYMSQFAPSVIVSREILPDGKLTPMLALSIEARVLDGNHRVIVLKKLYGESKRIKVRVYFDFGNAAMEKVIASSFNEATEALAKMTIFDKIFYYSDLVRATIAKTKKKDVNSGDLRVAYKAVGATPPSDQHLRNMKKIVSSLSCEAFETIRELSEYDSNSKTIDKSAITVAYLARKPFLAMKERPHEQAICIQLIARFKGSFGRPPKAADLSIIEAQAGNSALMIDGIEAIVPAKDWTPELREEVNKCAYEMQNYYDLQVKPHLDAINEDLAARTAKLPAGKVLDSSVTAVLKQQPMGIIRKVLSEDRNLKPFLDTWDGTLQEALNKANLVDLQPGGSVNNDESVGGDGGGNMDPPDPGPGGDGSGGHEDDENGDSDGGGGSADENGDGNGNNSSSSSGSSNTAPKKGSRKGQRCKTCKPPATATYYCVDCLITHCGSCTEATLASSEQPETNKRRRCKVCAPLKTRSGRNLRKRRNNDDKDQASTASKKKKTTAGSELLANLNGLACSSEDEKMMVEQTARCDTAVLHDILILSADTPNEKVLSLPQVIKDPVMLAIVSIAAEETLLQDTHTVNTRLGTIIGAVQQTLHPSGSMALFVPQPWHTHLHRLTGALQQPGTAMSVEENCLVLQYSGRLGGRPSTSATNHLRRSLDCIVIAHNQATTSGGKAFTCNSRVTVDDVYGQHNLGGPAAPVLPLMSQVPFPGADTDFPERALQFLINRFTRPGDTVLSVCGESNKAIEISLNRARRVEVVMAELASTKELTKRMDDSFLMAYREGKFKAPTDQNNREVIVGPNQFPQALLFEDVTPDKVKTALTISSESGMADSEAAEQVAKSVAADFNWTIKRADEADPLPSLYPRDGVGYTPGSSDVALWGTLVVYRSPLEAWKSLSDDDKEGQYVRLVKVANNKQLSKLLVPGKELCGPTAELFLRVAPTCPAYYALWESNASLARMEVVSKLSNSGSRKDLLSKFIMDGTSDVCPVRLRVHRHVRASKRTRASAILVDPGNRVVRSIGFQTSDVGDNNLDNDEEEDGGGDGEEESGGESGDDEEEQDGDGEGGESGSSSGEEENEEGERGEEEDGGEEGEEEEGDDDDDGDYEGESG